MRKSEAFNRGKKDGREGLEPSPVGGKIPYTLGYQIGRQEWEQAKLTRQLELAHSEEKPSEWRTRDGCPE